MSDTPDLPPRGRGDADGGFDERRRQGMVLDELARIRGLLIRLRASPHLAAALQATAREGRSDLSAEERQAVALLAGAQDFMMQQPVAAQALFAGLVAEGRRYARTDDGAALAAAMADDPLVERIRRLWEATSLNMLEEDPGATLPSAWIELVEDLSDVDELESVLQALRTRGLS